MELKGKEVENEKDFQFQQDLNKWFQNQGIIADLRSHLRYLMISALQGTQSATKPNQKASLKTQALNLLIAEYLFRLECHYTLSIFTSEVPALSGFSCLAPFLKSSFQRNSSFMNFFEKQLPNGKNKFKKFFKEDEIQEIFNALGFSLNSEELGYLKSAYFKSCNDTSLLELFLSSIVNMSCQLNMPKIADRNNKPVGKDDLSVQWSLEVKRLLGEQIKEPQLSAFYNSLVSITENEFKKLLEKDHLEHVEALKEREIRIREHLMKYENDIMVRLAKAKNDLILCKSFIDKKLMEKQKVLFKMVLEWKSKHEEIIEVSKQFYVKHNENRILQKAVGEMEEKIKYYEMQEIKQNEKMNKLKSQIKSLVKKIKVITERKNTCNGLFEELPNKESVSRLTIPEKIDVKESDADNCHLDKCRSPTQNSSTSITTKEEVVNNSFCNSPSEEILLRARNRLQVLAKESLKINKNYWECKNKYCESEDSDSSKEISSDSAQEEVNSVENIFDTPQKKLNASRKRKKTGVMYHLPTEEVKNENSSSRDAENLPLPYSNIKNLILQQRKEEKPVPKVPSQRQIKNRECFFKNKKLLQELEDQRLVEELIATTTTLSTGGSSSETFNELANVKVNAGAIRNLIQDAVPSASEVESNISIYDEDKVLVAESQSPQKLEENVSEISGVVAPNS